ncbi:MAG: hypothetical protein M3Z08_11500 [Chloroflexota bacterium]|nr:hypothetical protein [Chloroflexota bacterium]
MRAAAVALVLIVGAAVVLWFGNTLNSWVLGGLIGGLAALLLSIPISLTLFSFLSRRHDERLRAEIQEEMEQAQAYDYPALPQKVYDADGYMLPGAGEEYEEEEYRHSPPNHRLPPAANYPRLPAAGQTSPAPATAFQQRSMISPAAQSQQERPGRAARGKGASTQRLSSPARRTAYPGVPGYQGDTRHSQHRTAALRAARFEASQQLEDEDVEVVPPVPSRKRPAPRPTTPLREQPASQQVPGARPARQQLTPPANHYRQRPTNDASAGRTMDQRRLPTESERSPRSADPRTEQLSSRQQQQMTGSLHRYPQTGQIGRHPQIDEQLRHPDRASGSLKNPLVRRPPYMYEDDALREELHQQMDRHGPITRRSSLYDSVYTDEEEQ